MTELEAWTQIVIMLSALLSLPFVCRIGYAIGKLFIIKFIPLKRITIEIKRTDGTIEIVKVNASDNKALVNALLHSTGRVLK
ncbi:hypothetical protein JQC92_18285 [Shewanella sp. 202IG2-18]|uniref:hypothetical protein n=1 Tax=Parashewanella hymeniacidonis TaxID=2807618 RepID=UPI00196040D1|nr:hypothetical protein [Parashewanella hymeniacidonis]MBM7073959.1 hypothetical protein [Parashewanella hymeniacidonis]